MRISVCIATYNGEKYINEQLLSILKQLGPYDEIIVSDDKSEDRTIEIIKNINDNRIHIFSKEKFGSPIFNFENALKKASGEFIFLSDQDDIWLDNKVTIMMEALINYDVVVSNAIIGDASLNTIRDSYFSWRRSRKGVMKNFIRNSYLGCCMAFRRNLLDKALPFPKKIPMHDMWLGMIAELYYKPIFIPDKLMIYRRHSQNATFLNENLTSNENTLTKLKFRFNILEAAIKRYIKIRT